MKKLPDIDFLNSIFDLSDSGVLFWKIGSSRSAKAGSPAGYVGNRGYINVCIKRKYYLAHRIVWKMHYGEDPNGFIDHIDGVKINNNIENLRISTNAQNCANSSFSKNNSLGVKGVYKIKNSKKFAASICVNGKSIHLGRFDCKYEASDAYIDAAKKYFGDFARR